MAFPKLVHPLLLSLLVFGACASQSSARHLSTEYVNTKSLVTGTTISWTHTPPATAFQFCTSNANTWLAFATSAQSTGAMTGSQVVLGSATIAVERYAITAFSKSGVNKMADVEQTLTDVLYTPDATERSCLEYTIEGLEDGDQTFIWAHGSAGGSSLGYHEARGGVILNLENGDGVVVLEDGRKVFYIHGALMLVAWAVLVPIGILVARFGKSQFPAGQWLLIHRVLVVSGAVLAIAAFASAKTLTNDGKGGFSKGPHKAIGYFIVFAGAILMPILGVVRPHATEAGETTETRRFVWELVHKNLGKVVGVTALYNLIGGWKMVDKGGLSVLSVVALVLVILAAAGMEVMGVGKAQEKKREDSTDAKVQP